MATVLKKEIIVRLPMPLYQKAKKISDGEFKTFSGFIRELILEKVGDRLSAQEREEGLKASHEFKAGKGIAWRKVKRG